MTRRNIDPSFDPEEIAQLLYHVQVMMVAKGLRLEDVYRHL